MNLPGTPRTDMSPQEILAELERLKSKLDPLLAAADGNGRPDPVRIPNGRVPKCFIIMPFEDNHLNVVYEDFVRAALEDECKFKCTRGDDIFGPSAIMEDIRQTIFDTDFAVADLTGQNANVFYELGICHTIGKQVLMLAQSKEDIPFDVRHLRVLLYDYTPRGCKRLQQAVKDHVLSMLARE